MSKSLAIIPVRTGSKRLPGKNMQNFFGKPMFVHTIDHAKSSGLFDEIHVSTESEEVARICESEGVKPLFLRPNGLATDTATLQSVCEFVLKEYEFHDQYFDTFCMLWATAPLRLVPDITASFSMLADDVEAVVSVTDYDLPIFSAHRIDASSKLEPLFKDMLRMPGRDLPKVVCVSGSLCWVKTDAFRRHKTWLPPKLAGYHVPRRRSVDIDTEEDWLYAEFLYQRYVLAKGRK